MQFPSRLILSLLAFFAVASQAIAASSVWKVQHKNNTLYLAGTFHLLNESDHPLPEEFNLAYAAASKIVFETDLTAAQSPEFQLKFLKALAAAPGGTLKTSLKPETWAKLSAFMQERKVPIERFEYYSPAGMTLMLALMEYQRMGMTPVYGVDFHFSNLAIKDQKSTHYLESIDDQLGFLAALGQGDEMVLYTLDELSKMEVFVQKLKQYWREGNTEELDKIASLELREKFKETYELIVVKRNNKWLPQIEAMLGDEKTEAVMVGAMHLAGPDGLLVQLQQKGYKVQQVQAQTP
jgi:uncharacterized protein